MTRLLRKLLHFRRAEAGAMTVEAAILIPFLFVLILICYVVFDAIRQQAVNQRATYAITDMFSRETELITPDYMTNAREMLRFVSGLPNSDVTLRVSVAEWDEDNEEFVREWSETRGPALVAYTDANINDIADRLPIMTHEEQVIVIETVMEYDPPFNLGFLPRQIRTFSFASPRYAPQLRWCESDCGDGGGAGV